MAGPGNGVGPVKGLPYIVVWTHRLVTGFNYWMNDVTAPVVTGNKLLGDAAYVGATGIEIPGWSTVCPTNLSTYLMPHTPTDSASGVSRTNLSKSVVFRYSCLKYYGHVVGKAGDAWRAGYRNGKGRRVKMQVS